jgi:hypothetical protein
MPVLSGLAEDGLGDVGVEPRGPVLAPRRGHRDVTPQVDIESKL